MKESHKDKNLDREWELRIQNSTYWNSDFQETRMGFVRILIREVTYVHRDQNWNNEWMLWFGRADEETMNETTVEKILNKNKDLTWMKNEEDI